MRVNVNPLLKNLIKSMNYEIFNIFPTTICVCEISDHQNYKKNFYDVYHKFDYEEDDVNTTVSENVGNPLIHHEDCLDDLFTEDFEMIGRKKNILKMQGCSAVNPETVEKYILDNCNVTRALLQIKNEKPHLYYEGDCLENEVISWDENSHVDKLIYLNGMTYVRQFLSWKEGEGYDLIIGREKGPQSYVVWEIVELGENKSSLTITVYPYLLVKMNKIL